MGENTKYAKYPGGLPVTVDYAKKAINDCKGNRIDTTYATQSWANDKFQTKLPQLDDIAFNGGEAYLKWGGKNFAGDYGPIDAALIPALGANRTALINGDSVSVEYSRDNGQTWIDYGLTKGEKTSIFSGPRISYSIITGKPTADDYSDVSNRNQVRVTINTVNQLYTILNKFVIYCSTNGSVDCSVTIRCRTHANKIADIDNWFIAAENVPINGWSGYNVVNTGGLITYGRGDDQYQEFQFIFKYGSIGEESKSYRGLGISNIYCFGGVGWSTPSPMAAWGQAYEYDANGNVTFPNSLYTNHFTSYNEIYAVGYLYEQGQRLEDRYFSKNGGTLNGSLTLANGYSITSSYINTGEAADSYFQSRRFRGEGNASTYYHAVDFGYAGHDRVDFYEYGGIFAFWRNETSTATTSDSDRVAEFGIDYIKNKQYTYTYPNKNGTLAVVGDIPTDTSDLTNGAGYITSSALSGYATQSWVNDQGFYKSNSGNNLLMKTGVISFDAGYIWISGSGENISFSSTSGEGALNFGENNSLSWGVVTGNPNDMSLYAEGQLELFGDTLRINTGNNAVINMTDDIEIYSENGAYIGISDVIYLDSDHYTAIHGYMSGAGPRINISTSGGEGVYVDGSKVATGFVDGQSSYASCSTSASTAAKTVSVSGFVLKTGSRICVKFSYEHTSTTAATLNVNSTGAKTIYWGGTSTTVTSTYSWPASSIVELVYDGSYWRIINVVESYRSGIQPTWWRTTQALATTVGSTKSITNNSTYFSCLTGRSFTTASIKLGDIVISTNTGSTSTRYIYIGYVSSKTTSSVTVTTSYISNATNCLRDDTLITMTDGSRKPIAEVKMGDEILSYDFEKKQTTKAIVLHCDQAQTENHDYYLMYEGNRTVCITWEHDVLALNKGTWVKSDRELDVGDTTLDEQGNEIKFLAPIDWVPRTDGKISKYYHILTSNNCYYANGILMSHNPVASQLVAYNDSLNEKVKSIILDTRDETFVNSDLVTNPEFMAKHSDYLAKIVNYNCELGLIKNNLSKSDIKQFQYNDGTLTEEEYAPIREQRIQWRKDYNRIETEQNEVRKIDDALKVQYSPFGEDVLLSPMELRSKLFYKSCKIGNENFELFKKYFKKEN